MKKLFLKANHLLTRLHTALLAVSSMFLLTIPNCVALAEGDDSELDKEKIIGGFDKLIEYMEAAIVAVGAIFILIGVVSIATSIKSGEQNPEAITGAAKNIIIGALFIAVEIIINFFK